MFQRSIKLVTYVCNTGPRSFIDQQTKFRVVNMTIRRFSDNYCWYACSVATKMWFSFKRVYSVWLIALRIKYSNDVTSADLNHQFHFFLWNYIKIVFKCQLLLSVQHTSTHRDALLIVSRLLSLVAGIWKFEIYLLQKYTYLPESTNWGDSTYYFQGCTYAFVFSTSSYKRNLVNKDDQISTESLITIDNCYFYSGTWHRHYVLFPAGFRC